MSNPNNTCVKQHIYIINQRRFQRKRDRLNSFAKSSLNAAAVASIGGAAVYLSRKYNPKVAENEIITLTRQMDKKYALSKSGVEIIIPDNHEVILAKGENIKPALIKLAKENSFYDVASNKVVVLKENLADIGHELGHASNWTNKYLGKILKYVPSRNKAIALTVTPILLIGIISKMKDKKNIFAEHTGFLTFLVVTPKLLDEFLASFKPLRIAHNNQLKLFKQLLTNYSLAFITYAAPFISIALLSKALVDFTKPNGR